MLCRHQGWQNAYISKFKKIFLLRSTEFKGYKYKIQTIIWRWVLLWRFFILYQYLLELCLIFCLSKKGAASSLGMYVSLLICITSVEDMHGCLVITLPENTGFTSFILRKKESRLRKIKKVRERESYIRIGDNKSD